MGVRSRKRRVAWERPMPSWGPPERREMAGRPLPATWGGKPIFPDAGKIDPRPQSHGRGRIPQAQLFSKHSPLKTTSLCLTIPVRKPRGLSPQRATAPADNRAAGSQPRGLTG